MFLILFQRAGLGFVNDNAFKLSASLSYYTIFALGPLLIIVISLAGIFFGREAAQGRIYGQINGLVGNEAALQIQEIIKNIQQTQASTTGAIIGGVILIVGATGVFTEMQDSINYIWSVRAKPKKSWLKFLTNRLLSFSLVVGLGFLLLVSLIVNALLNLLSDRLPRFMPEFSVHVIAWINQGIILVVITGLFAVIFKVLPDAIISWKDALIGALITALLFLLGKFGIGYYLARSNFDITYGAAASIIILLTWVYYSALILYFGAEFTKMYALQAGSGIRPKDTAVFIIKKESREVPQSHLDT
ncbi:YihY/virulence factor BrkB family protein [Flaviaesturariibacter amylovorans]|uniref:YihY/virulence factor BrkB family protein n=1 Tax=Flaviaesturariibacter amylovorans TaxID=1084520 RepID=UPI0031EDD452